MNNRLALQQFVESLVGKPLAPVQKDLLDTFLAKEEPVSVERRLPERAFPLDALAQFAAIAPQDIPDWFVGPPQAEVPPLTFAAVFGDKPFDFDREAIRDVAEERICEWIRDDAGTDLEAFFSDVEPTDAERAMLEGLQAMIEAREQERYNAIDHNSTGREIAWRWYWARRMVEGRETYAPMWSGGAPKDLQSGDLVKHTNGYVYTVVALDPSGSAYRVEESRVLLMLDHLTPVGGKRWSEPKAEQPLVLEDGREWESSPTRVSALAAQHLRGLDWMVQYEDRQTWRVTSPNRDASETISGGELIERAHADGWKGMGA